MKVHVLSSEIVAFNETHLINFISDANSDLFVSLDLAEGFAMFPLWNVTFFFPTLGFKQRQYKPARLLRVSHDLTSLLLTAPLSSSSRISLSRIQCR